MDLIWSSLNSEMSIPNSNCTSEVDQVEAERRFQRIVGIGKDFGVQKTQRS